MVIEQQKQEVDAKNKEITQSIEYAKRIQDAILPSSVNIEKVFPDSFILYKPRDIVSGDFYWIYNNDEGEIFFAVADCTGHGVPGAFMSMIGNSLLNELIVENGIKEPDKVLYEMRTNIIRSLGQKGEAGEAKDGMDMVLCRLDKKQNKLSFAGAHNSLYLFRDGELIEYRGSSRPVGYFVGRNIPFEKEEIEIQKGDMLYLFSDGYADQFGGPRGKKFMFRNFKKLLLSIHDKNMTEQQKILDKTLKDWMKGYGQVDDICVMGVRIWIFIA